MALSTRRSRVSGTDSSKSRRPSPAYDPAPIRYPTHEQDAAAGVAWLKNHSSTLGADPTRIFLVGHSSGAFITSPVEPFIPMMLFAIVFGLSMDYEVFLLSRVKEEWDRTGDAKESVADGLAATALIITAAALIMVFVFGSFLLEDDRIIKLFGTGLATAILLDATIVRMVLVPATMELLGEKNWWVPKWLDRILPHVEIEGHGDGTAPPPADRPATEEPERELEPV